MRGASHLLQPPAPSGSPTTPLDVRPFTTATARTCPTFRSLARRKPVQGSTKSPDSNARGTDRHGVEPDHQYHHRVPGPSSRARSRRFIFDYRGRYDLRLDRGPHSPEQCGPRRRQFHTPSAKLGAVYKGLAFGVNVRGVFLFATNFRAGTVDVFGPAPAGSTTGFYVPATTDGGFTDPNIPPGLCAVRHPEYRRQSLRHLCETKRANA